jgi:hypothetical protein
MRLSNIGHGARGNVAARAAGHAERHVTALPQGHDAWVVGDDPVVVVDWYGAATAPAGSAARLA